MNVSSYLDAFLAVYGWESYYIIYLALSAMGLFLYPLLRASIEIYIEYASNRGSNRDHSVTKRLITTLIMMFAVFFISMIPMVEISFDKMRAKQVCSAGEAIKDANRLYNNTKLFETDSTKVPIIPWLAMAIGNGLSAVIYEVTPCTLDLTETLKSQMNVSLDNAENPHELKSELNRYMSECQAKIRTAILDIYNNKRNTEFEKWFKEQIRNVSKDERGFWEDLFSTDKLKSHEELAILYSPDSELIKRIFFDGTANPPAKLRAELDQLRLSFVANSPVTGFIGANNGSSVQGNETPPSCRDWWQGQAGSEGLRTRLVSALSDNIVARQGNVLGVEECRVKVQTSGNMLIGTQMPNREACRRKIINDIYKGDENNYAKSILHSLQDDYTKESNISTMDEVKIGGLVVLDAVGQLIEKKTKIGLGNGVIQTIVSFYGTLYMLKLMLKNLLPMITMAIYMFWGIYMVVGAFKGETIIKGFILISSLMLAPSLWAVVEHLDDKLWEAMYGGSSSGGNVMGMLVLDAATSLFQVAILFILFHMVALAGGGNASSAVNSNQSMAQGISTRFGGGMLGGGAENLTKGVKSLGNRVIGKTKSILNGFTDK